MKLESRGRAKFRPIKNYDVSEVKKLLINKLEEEQQRIKKIDEHVEIENIHYLSNKFNVVSLFSGCGGLDLGLELSGLDVIFGEKKVNNLLKNKSLFIHERHNSIFNVVCAVDMFKEANLTFKKNFPKTVIQLEKDIRKIKNFPIGDIVLGGFPCPGFSEAGPRLIDDERNFLYIHFIRCLLQTKPFLFIAENVKGLLTLGKGEVAKQIIQDFESAGYKVQFKLVNASDYGVPQNRERVFIVGVRKDINYNYTFPAPTHGEKEELIARKNLEDAIGDLKDDPGEWYEGSYSSMYLSRNRKKKWTEQSFTIQASGRQAPLHPSGPPMKKIDKDKWELPGGESKHRRLSIKEVSRIQTFPDWFEYCYGSENISKNGKLDKVYKQIGNAVPVELARVISRPIAEWSAANMEFLKDKRQSFQQLPLI
ncbi:DNA cytosine methyltransferase [Evansella halocellulosilytica]|uniref:DNA cytosine methyltransferase n=1 Tax=Evansella halocellulosilytica TaxID=2011013 RepID=UPI000BB6A597|nr:DNA cytosine methyltransferase [Evansella halocellulosilytica]